MSSQLVMHPPSLAGTYYKAFLATSSTSVGELVEQALEKANISDSPDHYCIWQVATTPEGKSEHVYVLRCVG